MKGKQWTGSEMKQRKANESSGTECKRREEKRSEGKFFLY